MKIHKDLTWKPEPSQESKLNPSTASSQSSQQRNRTNLGEAKLNTRPTRRSHHHSSNPRIKLNPSPEQQS